MSQLDVAEFDQLNQIFHQTQLRAHVVELEGIQVQALAATMAAQDRELELDKPRCDLMWETWFYCRMWREITGDKMALT